MKHMNEMRALYLRRFLLRTTCSRDLCTLSVANLNYTIDPGISNNDIGEARRIFDENPTSRTLVSWNMIMNGYIQHDQTWHAKQLFDQMPVRDVVSWNIMLSGFRRTKNTDGLYQCFLQMGRTGVAINDYTVSMLLRAVLRTKFDVLIQQVHARAVHLALNLNVFVGSALIKGYASLGEKNILEQVFDDILMKNITSWNALVSGYMELGSTADAERIFSLMPERSIVSWTTLVNGYIRNKQIDEARSIFNKMSKRNVVSWTAMISGYVQNMRFMDALKLFLLMLESGTSPNHFTFSSVLDACAGCSSLLMGQQVHLSIIKSGIPDDVILLTSLVDMYAKCGDMAASFCVFESIPNKNRVSWNSIIGGCARHGLATQALEVFDRMERAGLTPDEVSYVNVLSACVHGGLVEEGEKHYTAMLTKYGIQAEMEHYTCMVDLYGRAGQFDKAEKLIQNMPFEPDVVLWGALLASCGLHSNLELGEFAAEKIRKLEKNHPVSYSVLTKIQGEKGIWNSVNDLRDMMKGSKVRKQKAISWVE
ncbi:hypothetical protein L6164_034805 [Bauhinia variegata]|uniref:Uncharacterized protein n=1 Tax=Bauhinia variegata TaxID=167791 RepID=A0ACB9KWP6_BAUVA|nr:hypothetical protein L6164_034805 [Bauhinia variegata]